MALEFSDYSPKKKRGIYMRIGPLMQRKGSFVGWGHLPHRAEIRAAMDHVGYEHVKLDPTNLTVRFSEPGMSLDPGGVGKGYAVDRMAAVVRNSGVSSALISGGGSSIYGIGVPPTDLR